MKTTLAALLLAAPTFAQIWTDDFDRPDGTQMGPSWTEVAGDLAITSLEGHGNMSSGWSKMQHQTASESWTEAYAEITYRPPTGTSGPHVALVLGDGGTRNIYTKIQDNDSNGTYDRIFFYSNDNGTSWGTTSSVALTTPFTDARVAMYVGADQNSLVVDIDRNFDGTPDETHVNVGLASFSSQLGSGYAVGTWARGRFDDWQAGDASLTGSPDSISVSAGGAQVLSITLGPAEALKTYQVLGSVSGDAPGFAWTGTAIPLNPDAYTFWTLLNPNTPLLNGSAGTLNSSGGATAVLTLPPGSDPALVGLTGYHAGLVLQPAPGTIAVTAATNSATVTFVP